jgi:tetratricopeptide (TPR) repeat protein
MGFLWYLLFVIPPTIYRLQNADIFFNYLEHRTYLPLIGIIIILAYFLDDHLTDKKFSKYFIPFYVLIIMGFSILAWIHCSDYKDHFSLTERAASLNNPSGLAGSSMEWLNKGDTTKAMEYIDKAIDLNNKDAGIYFQKGKLMAKMQKHEDADQNFSLALNMMPNLVDALIARSVERRMMKKYESAFRDIYAAAKIDSTNPKIYMTFGNLFLAVNDDPNALQSYSKAIQLQPMYAEAYNNRAYVKLLLHDDTGTIADCRRALVLMKDKPNPYVYNNMGHAFSNINMMDSAFAYFKKAIDGDPNFAYAYFLRGVAKQKINNLNDACADWNTAISLGYKDTSGVVNKYCRLSYAK